MTTNQYSDVAVVMITRNEERAIQKVIADAIRELPGSRVYVIDDSTDSTAELARQSGAQVFDGPRSGFGPAMHQALLTPDEAIIVTVDADDTYPPEILPTLVGLVREGIDVAGADRLGRSRPTAMPLSNYLVNRSLSLTASARARRRIHDVHSGQRAYRRELLHSIRWDYGYDAFPIDLIFIPAMLGYKVLEIPIEYRDRVGETTLHRWSSGKASLRRLLRARRDIKSAHLAPFNKDS